MNKTPFPNSKTTGPPAACAAVSTACESRPDPNWPLIGLYSPWRIHVENGIFTYMNGFNLWSNGNCNILYVEHIGRVP